MAVSGSFTVDGGLPRVTLPRLEWTVSGVSSLPANARISGIITTATEQRTFSFNLVLDD